MSLTTRPLRARRAIPFHVNLARVYVKLGQLDAAIAQLRVALAIAPQYRPARAEVHRLLGLLN